MLRYSYGFCPKRFGIHPLLLPIIIFWMISSRAQTSWTQFGGYQQKMRGSETH